MKHPILAFIARGVLIFGLLFLALSKVHATPMTHLVFMNEYVNGFSPLKVVIQKGDTVKWINRDFRQHNVVIPYLKVRSPLFKNEFSWSYTFDKAGIFEYYCAPHRTVGMEGIVEVRE